uniref:NADH-ubiquinone oxidoreductase chain 4 n=1 Tax=Symphylella sp. YG-2006 TaxID=390856 RepID=B7S770_9MYRI|nr:NADH dehydrogenase subunit 4 [Symphylella sp. YG-2006]ABQ01739.1 NADH dehydrogenase subunit 4 [Symphylella sp. YG-2006]
MALLGLIFMSIFGAGMFWVILGLVFSFIYTMVLMSDSGGFWSELGFGFGLDIIGWFLIILSIWVTLLMIMASSSYFVGLGGRNYFSIMVFLLVVLVVAFTVTDFLFFYFFFESSLIPILLMVLGWGYQPERIRAGFYLLFYTLTASMPLLVVLMWLGSLEGGLFMGHKLVSLISVFGFFCLVFAFMLKLPVFMFHLWLPKAHVEAPVAGSMILAGVLLKLGGYGFYRVLGVCINLDFVFILVSLGLLGGAFTGLVCLGQHDMKSLVAYSSVGHMGIVLAGVFSCIVYGVGGSYIMMIGHGVCSSGLFCLVNMFYERYSSRSMLVISGLLIFFPSFVLIWFLLCVVNMSCPPTINLLSEIMAFGGLLGWAYSSSFGLSILSFICAVYSLYLFSFSSHGYGGVKFVGWAISIREFVVGLLHIFPLFFFILKSDLFLI